MGDYGSVPLWGTEAQRRTVTSILVPGKGSVPLNHILPELPPDYLALGHQPFSLQPRPWGLTPARAQWEEEEVAV